MPTPYNKLEIKNKKKQIALFRSAVRALQDCHHEGLVGLNLKADSIHYDEHSGKSLIDIATSINEDETTASPFNLSLDATHAELECISEEEKLQAAKSMDICALGKLVRKACKKPSLKLLHLLDACQSKDPAKRPTLDELEEQLLNLWIKKTGVHVNRNDEFFISLGKKDFHSFIMVGVIQRGQPIILGRVGKMVANSAFWQTRSDLKFLLTSTFSHVESELKNESLNIWGNISYAAFAINFDQYLQFTKLLGLATRNSSLQCYLPSKAHNDQIIMTKEALGKTTLNDASEQEQTIVNRSHNITANNTCRHTAIDLIEYTQGIPHLTDNVSRSFFRKLPLTTNFSEGKPERHFYVFPLPPTAYIDDSDEDKKKRMTLTKIFQRMENLLKKDPYSAVTIQKFNALKNLYHQQALIPNGNVEDALQAIRLWKNENKDIINSLRKQSLFGKLFVSRSTTTKMVDKIEHLYSKKKM